MGKRIEKTLLLKAKKGKKGKNLVVVAKNLVSDSANKRHITSHKSDSMSVDGGELGVGLDASLGGRHASGDVSECPVDGIGIALVGPVGIVSV